MNERYVWPEIPPDENPITYVTNGVHLQTFLALEWVNLFDIRFGDWRANLSGAGVLVAASTRFPITSSGASARN